MPFHLCIRRSKTALKSGGWGGGRGRGLNIKKQSETTTLESCKHDIRADFAKNGKVSLYSSENFNSSLFTSHNQNVPLIFRV